MRDPKRIDSVMEILREAWTLSPDLRFNQLINAINKGEDCFYDEDDAFIEKVKEWINYKK